MDTSFRYIVNCPVYHNLNNPDAVNAEVQKILSTCSSIATRERRVSVVIGLNVPSDASAREEDLLASAERIKALAATLHDETVDVHIVTYRWDRFDARLKAREFKANERINYVAIRNNLFYSKENQGVIRDAIEEAKTHERAFIKFLALDGDSDLPAEEIDKLEEVWNQETHIEGDSVHLSPLITSGFYEFKFSPADTQLVNPDGTMNWGMYLAKIENTIDIESKQMISKEDLVVPLAYQKGALPAVDEEITNEFILAQKTLMQNNLILLDRLHLGPLHKDNKRERLMIHYCDFLALVPAFKEACQETTDEGRMSLPLLRDQMVKTLREIEKIEVELNHQNISLDFKLSGQQVLYPSENVMFVSLYDKVREREFNVFEEIAASQDAGGTKGRKLWGDDVGREEGENIAAQMRKFWERVIVKQALSPPSSDPSSSSYASSSTGYASPLAGRDRAAEKAKSKAKVILPSEQERSLVAFPRIFGTALPPRSHQFLTDQQKSIAATFPKTPEELRLVVADPIRFDELVENCVKLISTRSQTSLGEKFLRQRKRFIAGQQNDDHVLRDPKKKLTTFTRILRQAAAGAFEKFFEEFHAERLAALKAYLAQSIRQAAQP